MSPDEPDSFLREALSKLASVPYGLPIGVFLYVLRGHNLGPALGPALADFIKKHLLTPETLLCLVGGVVLVALHPALQAFHPVSGSLAFAAGPLLRSIREISCGILRFLRMIAVAFLTRNWKKLSEILCSRYLDAEEHSRPSQGFPAQAPPLSPPLQHASLAPAVPQAEQQPKEALPAKPVPPVPGDNQRIPDTNPTPGASGVN